MPPTMTHTIFMAYPVLCSVITPSLVRAKTNILITVTTTKCECLFVCVFREKYSKTLFLNRNNKKTCPSDFTHMTKGFDDNNNTLTHTHGQVNYESFLCLLLWCF